jgi:hypothetical protein
MTELIIEGGCKKIKEMYSAGKLDGVVGIGGATGTLMRVI